MFRRNKDYLEFQAAIDGEYLHAGGWNATELLLRKLELGAPVRVLEIGCGTGATLCRLAQRWRCSTVAVELSAAMLRRASRKTGGDSRVHLVRADASGETLPFRDEVFDLVLAESVAGIIDFRASLPGWVRVLKTGGTLALNDGLWRSGTPDHTVNQLTRLSLRAYGFSLLPQTCQTIQEWQSWIAECGLTDIETVQAAPRGAVIPAEARRRERWALLLRPHLWSAFLNYRRAGRRLAGVGEHIECWLITARKGMGPAPPSEV